MSWGLRSAPHSTSTDWASSTAGCDPLLYRLDGLQLLFRFIVLNSDLPRSRNDSLAVPPSVRRPRPVESHPLTDRTMHPPKSENQRKVNLSSTSSLFSTSSVSLPSASSFSDAILPTSVSPEHNRKLGTPHGGAHAKGPIVAHALVLSLSSLLGLSPTDPSTGLSVPCGVRRFASLVGGCTTSRWPLHVLVSERGWSSVRETGDAISFCPYLGWGIWLPTWLSALLVASFNFSSAAGVLMVRPVPRAFGAVHSGPGCLMT